MGSNPAGRANEIRRLVLAGTSRLIFSVFHDLPRPYLRSLRTADRAAAVRKKVLLWACTYGVPHRMRADFVYHNATTVKSAGRRTRKLRSAPLFLALAARYNLALCRGR